MSKLAIDSNAKPIQALRPSAATRVLSISGTATSGAAFADNVRVARIVATTDCFYRLVPVGGNATVNNAFLPANTIEYIHILEDDTVSLITSGSTGTAYVTAMI